MADPQRIIQGTVQVASLPVIYTKVDEALNRNASNHYLVDIVSEDTALSARLLRLGNSAMFNFPRKIDTISQAITIIGTQQLRALVLASSVVHLFKDIPADLINMESFWRHSIACGVAARVIASLQRNANIEFFFLAGLLHDIGRLVLFKELPNEIRAAMLSARETHSLLHQIEQKMLGFDHARLGGLLLKEWKLPTQLVEVTAYHHAPKRAADFPEEVAVIHIADLIANSLQLGSSGELLVPALEPNSWDKIGLPVNTVKTILKEIDIQYHVAVDFVLGSTADENVAA